MITIRTGASLAAAVAVVAMGVAASPSFAAEGAGKVHCYGINTCKGTSDCKTAQNDCKGMNVCKGHGFKEMSAKACAAAGGKTTEPKAN